MMSKKTIKIISIILAALMALSVLSVLLSVRAAEGATGTAAINDGALLAGIAAVCAVIMGLICVSNRAKNEKE